MVRRGIFLHCKYVFSKWLYLRNNSFVVCSWWSIKTVLIGSKSFFVGKLLFMIKLIKPFKISRSARRLWLVIRDYISWTPRDRLLHSSPTNTTQTPQIRKMFYEGDLHSGIAKALQESKLVACFVTGMNSTKQRELPMLTACFKILVKRANYGKTTSYWMNWYLKTMN